MLFILQLKIIEENTGSNFADFSHRNIFLDISPKARETTAKIKNIIKSLVIMISKNLNI